MTSFQKKDVIYKKMKQINLRKPPLFELNLKMREWAEQAKEVGKPIAGLRCLIKMILGRLISKDLEGVKQ